MAPKPPIDPPSPADPIPQPPDRDPPPLVPPGPIPPVARDAPLAIVSPRRIHQLFQISVFLKGIYGVLESTAGFLLALISPGKIVQWLVWLTHDEFEKDP